MHPIREAIPALVIALVMMLGVAVVPPARLLTTAWASVEDTAGASTACTKSWSVVPAPRYGAGGGWLNAVDARSKSEAWAVGNRTDVSTKKGRAAVARWDGKAWTKVASPKRGIGEGLDDVDTFGKRSAWAVGHYQHHDKERSKVDLRTHILRWDGTAWAKVKSPNAGTYPNGSLGGVAHVGKSTAWAVGSYDDPNPQTLTQRWDGTRWATVKSPNPPYPESYLHAVDGTGRKDVWAVGRSVDANGRWRTLAMHWNGKKWQIEPTPNRGKHENVLESVVAIAPDDVWAVGWSGKGPLALHWDGTSWTRSKDAETGWADMLAGVSATAPDRVFAAGSGIAKSGGVVPMTQLWNGSRWKVSKHDGLTRNDTWLDDIAAIPGRQWAVGSYIAADDVERPYIQQRCGG